MGLGNGSTDTSGAATEARIVDIAEAAAERAMHKTLLLIGIDLTDPIGAQRTFATLHEVARMVHDEEFRADLEHMRWWRKTIESMRDKGMVAIVGVVVTTVAAMMWLGFTKMLGK